MNFPDIMLAIQITSAVWMILALLAWRTHMLMLLDRMKASFPELLEKLGQPGYRSPEINRYVWKKEYLALHKHSLTEIGNRCRFYYVLCFVTSALMAVSIWANLIVSPILTHK